MPDAVDNAVLADRIPEDAIWYCFSAGKCLVPAGGCYYLAAAHSRPLEVDLMEVPSTMIRLLDLGAGWLADLAAILVAMDSRLAEGYSFVAQCTTRCLLDSEDNLPGGQLPTD